MNLKEILIKPAYAIINNPIIKDTTNVTQPKTYLNNVIQTIITVFFIVAVLYFIWNFVFAGIHMISSNGDPKKFESAQHQLVYALVGLMIVFSVFALLKFIGIVLGIPTLQNLILNLPSL